MFNENTERAKMRRSECHPLLRGTRAGKFTHGFSVAEMETLTFVYKIVLPPLPFDSPTTIVAASEKAFYEVSDSQSPISHEVAKTARKRGLMGNCVAGESCAVDSGYEVRKVVALWIALFLREMAFCLQILGDAIEE